MSQDTGSPLSERQEATVRREPIQLRRLAVATAFERIARSWDLPIVRHGHRLLLPRIFELRRSFSLYDASYVVLAERLRAARLTAGEGLARGAARHAGLTTLPGRGR